MAELLTGKLTYKGEGKTRKRHLVFTTKKGKPWDQPISPDLLAASLRANTDNEVEVAFETDPSGRPFRIRPAGESWLEPPAAASASRQGSGRTAGRSGGQHGQRERGRGAPRYDQRTETPGERRQSSRQPGDFHNPYNFIPAPPRKKSGTDLDDKPPAGHDRYHEDRWSGRITVKLTTKTPLLIPDAARARPNEKEKDHKHFPTRLGVDGKPYLPPTSIKGMLRAAYEAVTNSRMAVFEGHDKPLAFRMKTDEGLRMVPARIVEKNDGKWVEFYTGASGVDSDGGPRRVDTNNPNSPREPMFAAWLPYHGSEKVYYEGNSDQPEHQDEVEMWIEKFQHHRWDRSGRRHRKDFQYWRVRKIVRPGAEIGDAPAEGVDSCRCTCLDGDPNDCGCKGKSYHKPLRQTLKAAKGFVCVTNLNINNKHDERVFFNLGKSGLNSVKLGDRHERDWELLIEDYAGIHKDEIKQGLKQPPALSDRCTWSRHISRAALEENLTHNSLCYARVRVDGPTPHLLGLYPVMISRELHNVSPLSLLDKSLQAATEQEAMSPADRVFGWVNQKGKGAYRGNIRITPATCSDDALVGLGDAGLPLSILGQPKPQQSRFYVGCSNGRAQRDGLSSPDAAYSTDKSIRGRKVYSHHAGLPADYWDNPGQDLTQMDNNGFFQEYRRSNEAEHDTVRRGNRTLKVPRVNEQRSAFVLKPGDGQRDNQNRTIETWVKENATFTFTISVTNLSNFEMGALLWLLELPHDHFHRFGGGKPLAFGSVQLRIEWSETDIRKGNAWRDYYSTLDDLKNPVMMTEHSKEGYLDGFRDPIGVVYGDGNFEQAPFIKAFRACAKGFNKPIHYPRARWKINPPGQPNEWISESVPVPPHPEGKSFQWFVANEQIREGRVRQGLALQDLADDQGLPYLDET
jgi:CRISPR-associated protein (TIGR03986 family)